MKYGQSFLDKDAFMYLPDIRKLKIKDINEKQFYKLIGLTQEEIKLFDKNNIEKNDTNNLTDETKSDTYSEKNVIVSQKKMINKTSKNRN